jgi:16S rRNA (adenine1518-N6/adenine1519-N6)-dimethyltransferase
MSRVLSKGGGFNPPRKSLGQNFLHQKNVVRAIIDAVAPGELDTVVEIGPGRGALTLPLLEKVKLLHVIELDRDLAGYWIAQSAARPNLVVHHARALDFSLSDLVGPGDRASLRMVGNLPYNISSPILFHLIAQSGLIRDMHLMFQREVVQRMTALPGNRQYGRLSVMVQQSCAVEKIIRVAPGAFIPPPKVESAVVRLRPHDSPRVPVENLEAFSKVVKLAFSKRRKTLKNALLGLLDASQICVAGIDPMARAEQLSVADFAALSRTYVRALPTSL